MGQTDTTQSGFGNDADGLTGVHWVAIGLAALTGIIHLYLYWTQDFVPFLLAGLGFFGAIALIFVGFRRRLVYLAGIPYTLAQMAGWFVLDGTVTTLAVVDKVAQVLLVALLVYLYWKETSQAEEYRTDVTA